MDKNKLTPARKIRQEFNQKQNDNIEKYFHKISEKLLSEKKVCSCCGKPYGSNDFWRSYTYANAGRLDEDGKMCVCYCKSCSYQLFDYYYSTYVNLEKAMEHTCLDLNVYWDPKLLKDAKVIYERNQRKLHILSEYMGALGRTGIESLGLTYWESPNVQGRELVKIDDIPDKDKKEKKDEFGFDTPINWAREDAENRKKIMRIFRYDPFIDAPDDEKPILYSDLMSMIDDAMEEDFIKLKAALEIVLSFNKIEKWRKKITILENKKDPPMAEIKALSQLRDAERKNITEFCRDNGFSQRYAQSKAKGSGTLSGIMDQMREKQYENGLLNMYDIETSESINQAAEASMKAIFNQLNVGDNEKYIIVQQQRDTIIKLEKESKRLAEELRKAKIEIERMKLEKKKLESEQEDD